MTKEYKPKNRWSPKPGDKRGWNEKTGTGYKWEVKNGKGKWIRYRNNKRQVSNTVTATGNVDVVGGIKNFPRRAITAPYRFARNVYKIGKHTTYKQKDGTTLTREEAIKKVKANKEKVKIKKETLERAKENLNKPKTKNEKTLENIKKSREVIEKYKNKNKTSSSSSSKKRLSAREKMRAKNVERFGEAHVAHLQAKHADFKKMKRKEMSKEAFIKKYPKSQTAKRFNKSRR